MGMVQAMLGRDPDTAAGFWQLGGESRERKRASIFNCHAPRKRGIQQYEALMMNSKLAEYWVARSSRAMTDISHQNGGPRPAVLIKLSPVERVPGRS
jgi:hypothetical protein